jgi:hypothetical protein
MIGVFDIQQCDVGDRCLNSIGQLGAGAGKCGICRFAPDNVAQVSYWRPADGKEKHPAAVALKQEKKKQRLVDLRTKKQGTDKNRTALLKLAAKAEQQTEWNLIRATKNSGRSNRDGDHVAAGQITLDTKLQSTREHPVVKLEELAKVREDAKNAGNSIGALVLRNKHGVGVVAIAEADFARLIRRLV